jgi:succinate--hydroxymethylglutarate CoA-transferase
MKHPDGIRLLQDLSRHCDVLVENYVPGKLDKLGLGYDRLRQGNPRLIYASITGYGPTGPFAHRAGYDVIIEAEAGLMHITGEPTGEPVKVGVAITDLTTGLYAQGAIMAALYARERTSQGQKIDLSLLECQVANLVNVGSNYLIGGQEAQRRGTTHASIVPYQSFRTQDAYFVIGAGNDGQFVKMCKALGRHDLMEDGRYKTNASRVQHREMLVQELSRMFEAEPTSHWIEVFKDSGLPHGPVNNMAQTFAHPQVLHREMVQTVQHPTAGEIKLTGIPVKYSLNKPEIRRPPPLLGQHNEEILRDVLGLDEKQVKRLREDGVVGSKDV